LRFEVWSVVFFKRAAKVIGSTFENEAGQKFLNRKSDLPWRLLFDEKRPV